MGPVGDFLDLSVCPCVFSRQDVLCPFQTNRNDSVQYGI